MKITKLVKKCRIADNQLNDFLVQVRQEWDELNKHLAEQDSDFYIRMKETFWKKHQDKSSNNTLGDKKQFIMIKFSKSKR